MPNCGSDGLLLGDRQMSVSLDLLGSRVLALQSDIRSVRRELAMLRAQQGELPTAAQFQAGLDAVDQRITELHQELLDAIGELTALVASLRTGGA